MVLTKLEYLVVSTKKVVSFNQIFINIQENSFVGSRNVFFQIMNKYLHKSE